MATPRGEISRSLTAELALLYTARSDVQLLERLASLGIMGEHLKAPGKSLEQKGTMGSRGLRGSPNYGEKRELLVGRLHNSSVD